MNRLVVVPLILLLILTVSHTVALDTSCPVPFTFVSSGSADTVMCQNDIDGATFTVNALQSVSTASTPSTYNLAGNGDGDAFTLTGPIAITAFNELFTALGGGTGDVFTVASGGNGTSTFTVEGGTDSTFSVNGGNGNNSYTVAGGSGSTVTIHSGALLKSSAKHVVQDYEVQVGSGSTVHIVGNNSTSYYDIRM